MNCTPKEFVKWRRSIGITQREMAIILGVDQITVSKMERGLLKIRQHPRFMFVDLIFRAEKARYILRREGTEFPYTTPVVPPGEKDEK